MLSPERVEELVAGAAPEGAEEFELTQVVRELRGVETPAPAALRERIHALGEPADRAPRRRLWPRVALVLAPVTVALLAAALLNGAGSGDQTAADAGAGTTVVTEAAQASRDSTPDAGTLAPKRARLDLANDTTRVRDYNLWLQLRVPNADRLGEAADDAQRIAADLGGYVMTSNVSTDGPNGRAELVLQIPSRRVQDAMLRFSELGTITGQRVAVTDLQEQLDRRRARIDSLRRAIRVSQLRLQSGTLSPEERLKVQLQLERQRGLLNDLARQNRSTLREGAFAEFYVTLATGQPVAREGSRFGDAVDDAVAFLARAGAVALFLLIVLSPLIAIAAAWFFLARTRTRRFEERVLERSRPAATS